MKHLTTSRRAVLAGLAAAATVPAPSLATAMAGLPMVPAPDPILAAIERHQAAWEDLGDRCGDLADDEAPEAQAALAALHEEVGAAVDDLNYTEPTTIAGAVALLRYASDNQELADMLGVELHDPGVLADALERIDGVRS